LIVVFTLLVLSVIYGIVILGLVLLLRKMGVSEKRAIILSFLVFGAVTGILTAWVWPIDSSIYFNFFASLLGDQVYNLSIQYFGDSSSPQAHYTIPWILRIPQVYVIASIILCGLVSLPLQWVYKRGAEGE
jgi:disulfide bond formation protein DsbB